MAEGELRRRLVAGGPYDLLVDLAGPPGLRRRFTDVVWHVRRGGAAVVRLPSSPADTADAPEDALEQATKAGSSSSASPPTVPGPATLKRRHARAQASAPARPAGGDRRDRAVRRLGLRDPHDRGAAQDRRGRGHGGPGRPSRGRGDAGHRPGRDVAGLLGGDRQPTAASQRPARGVRRAAGRPARVPRRGRDAGQGELGRHRGAARELPLPGPGTAAQPRAARAGARGSSSGRPSRRSGCRECGSTSAARCPGTSGTR